MTRPHTAAHISDLPTPPARDHTADPRHPSRQLYQIADRLQNNHPKMAQEMREQADSVKGQRPFTAYETLQNNRAYIQTRHLQGVSCRERNLWLSAEIGNLSSPASPVTDHEPLCSVSLYTDKQRTSRADRTEATEQADPAPVADALPGQTPAEQPSKPARKTRAVRPVESAPSHSAQVNG